MTTLEQLTNPVADTVRTALRPATYTANARELTSIALTASMWPFGFAGSSLPALDVGEGSDTSPVLLLHGYGANKSNWLFVSHHLRSAGFRRLHAFNYNPLTGDIRELAARCVAEAERLRAHVGAERIHLVGHSLGGLIARYAVQVLGLRNVGICATVASPHQGLGAAHLTSLVGGFGPARSVHDLRPGSAVMAQLRSARPLASTRFVAYYSNLDLIVPAKRAQLGGDPVVGDNVLIEDRGHLSIMLSRTLSRSLVEHLVDAEPNVRPAVPQVSRPVTHGRSGTSPAG